MVVVQNTTGGLLYELTLDEVVVVVQNTTGFLLEEEAELALVRLLVGFDQVGLAELAEELEIAEEDELVSQNKTGFRLEDDAGLLVVLDLVEVEELVDKLAKGVVEVAQNKTGFRLEKLK